MRVFVAGFAKAHRQVDETWGHDAPAGVDHAAGRGVPRSGADGEHPAVGHCNISDLVETAGGVDHPPAVN